MPGTGGIIFDIDHFAVHDGPGIRSVVYFKGCPMRCLWCHSPESIKKEPESIFIKEKCISCNICAGDKCLHGARKTCGCFVSEQDLLDELLPQCAFFESSGGGVTFSGGEPLMQPEFIAILLQKLQEVGIHTIIETSMMCDRSIIQDIYPFVDEFYCDVKIIDSEKHKRYTGCDNKIILSNIELLAEEKNRQGITLRIPLIPGHTDASDDIAEIFRFAQNLDLSDIHLLPYNPSAPAKYEWLSMIYKPGKLERQDTQYLNELLSIAPADLNVTII